MKKFLMSQRRLIYIISSIFAPLLIVDVLLINLMISTQKNINLNSMEKQANSVQYTITSTVDSALAVADSIYMNKYIYEFLSAGYREPMDYIDAYQSMLKSTLMGTNGKSGRLKIFLYAANESLISGGQIHKLSEAKEQKWYKYLQESGLDRILYFEYDDSKVITVDDRRRILLLQKLNFYKPNEVEKVLAVEIDYGSFIRTLHEMNYTTDVYICLGDKIVLSNGRYSSVGSNYFDFDKSLKRKTGFEQVYNIVGQNLKIKVIKPTITRSTIIAENFPLIFIFLTLNVVVPVFLLGLVYNNRLREQHMMVARQNAELLALRNQINPHFLFNSLESIRMHSVIKNETTTAEMVEKLAYLQRQYVDWGNDLISIKSEMEFVQNYLDLQKYRFGDRLSFSLQVDEDCEKFLIPKLTIVTFVENACIHGIEEKSSPGWIFVRIFKKNNNINLEIEDTGNGMSKEEKEEILMQLREASIDLLKNQKHIGCMNASLRLKMYTKGHVEFDIDSETGVGTLLQIIIPCQS